MPKIHSFSTHTFYFSLGVGFGGEGGTCGGGLQYHTTEDIKHTHLPCVRTYRSYLCT